MNNPEAVQAYDVDFSSNLKYVYADEMRARFYSNKDETYLHFKVGESGFVEPSHITFEETKVNSGTKISIEMLDNGAVVKSGKTSKVCMEIYALTDMVKKLSETTTLYKLDYDENCHEFDNLEEVVNEIAEYVSNNS